MPGVGMGMDTPLLVLFGLNGASLSFPALALSYVANDRARIPVDLLSVYGAVSFLPWSLKPCYAYLDVRWRRAYSGGCGGCHRSSWGGRRSRWRWVHHRRRILVCPNDDNNDNDEEGNKDDDNGGEGEGGRGRGGGRHVLLASLLLSSGIAMGLTILVPKDGVTTCVALGALRGLCFAFPEFLLGLTLLEKARVEWECARAAVASSSSSSPPDERVVAEIEVDGQELRATSSSLLKSDASGSGFGSGSGSASEPSFEAIAGSYQARAAGARNVGSLLASALLLVLLALRWLFLGHRDGGVDDALIAMDDAFVDAILLATAAMPILGAIVAMRYRVGSASGPPALPDELHSRSSAKEADGSVGEDEGAWVGMKGCRPSREKATKPSFRSAAEVTLLPGKRLVGCEEDEGNEDEAVPLTRFSGTPGTPATGAPPNRDVSFVPQCHLELSSSCLSQDIVGDIDCSDHGDGSLSMPKQRQQLHLLQPSPPSSPSSPLLPRPTLSPSSQLPPKSHTSPPRPPLLSRTEMTALATFQVLLVWVGLRQPLSDGLLRPVGWAVVLSFLLLILLLLSSSLVRLLQCPLRASVGRRGVTSEGWDGGGRCCDEFGKVAKEESATTATSKGDASPPPLPPLSRSVALFLVLKHSVPQPSYQWSSYTYHLLRSRPLYLQMLSLVNIASSTLASVTYGRFVAPRCRHRCDLILTLGWTTAASALASLSYLVVIDYNRNNGHDDGDDDRGEGDQLEEMAWRNFLLAIPVVLLSTFFYELQFLPSVVLATSTAMFDDVSESTKMCTNSPPPLSSSAPQHEEEMAVVALNNSFVPRLPDEEVVVGSDARNGRVSSSLHPPLSSQRHEAPPAAAANATAPKSPTAASIHSDSGRSLRRANVTNAGGTVVHKNEGKAKSVRSTETGSNASGMRYGTYVSCIDLGDQLGAWMAVPIVSAVGITRSDWSRVSDLVLVCSACSLGSVLFLVLLLLPRLWSWPCRP